MYNDEHNLWKMIGFLEASPSRKKTIICIGEEDYKKPSEIGREMKLTSSQVSNALKDLKEEKLVKCLNEDASKGRLYANTELGLEVLKRLKQDH
ncbi:MarR family transcriptional regulator [Methanobrevibacter sp.]|uniref:MarR family transcriptional regulator n=1 Tax=Methanobrevibacter sp. TaxID=66852 RepID=UPI0026DF1C12|nr:MarR family transcriptional regulator [Methanobrevibacter sp.]MDO5859921.1 MarR family transcriptional regulator [Methanobrevibacter sp.]